MAALQQGLQFADHGTHHTAQVDALHVEGPHRTLQLGDLQQVVHQREHALACGMDAFKHARQLGLRAATQHAQLGKAQNGLQRRAQLMAHVGHKLGLGAGRLFGRITRFLSGALSLTELAHIHQDGEHAGDLAMLIRNGRLGQARIAARSIAMAHLCFHQRPSAPAQQLLVGRQVRLDFIRGQALGHCFAQHGGALAALIFLPRLVHAHKAVLRVGHRNG